MVRMATAWKGPEALASQERQGCRDVQYRRAYLRLSMHGIEAMQLTSLVLRYSTQRGTSHNTEIISLQRARVGGNAGDIQTPAGALAVCRPTRR